MGWRSHQDTAAIADALSFPPSGGKVKVILLGIILPTAIGYFGATGLLSKEALWIGSESNINVTGRTAVAISIAYSGVGLLCHIRWVWGLLGFHHIFEIGTVISTLAIISGIAAAFWFEFGFSVPHQ